MIKYLFILINSLSLFIYGLFSDGNGITVSGRIPTAIHAGEEVAIELTVNKGSMNGFAKLQLDLPDGITIKESEDKGANYTYSGTSAKWVWAALPTESEITIKLIIIASESDMGLKTINAKYSYVENNVKQVVEMNPADITVVAPGTDLSTLGSTPLAKKEDSTNKEKPVVNPVAANSEPAGDISVIRTIGGGSVENEFVVNLKIKKGATKGFARFSDDIPNGVTAKAINTEGGSFSVADGKIKFVWVNVPDKEELEISYSLQGSTQNAVTLGGEYSYLEDNQSKKFKLPMESIAFQTPQVAINKTEPTETKQPEKTEEPVVEQKQNPVVETKVNSIPEKKEGNMNFHVQVGAFTNSKVSAQTLIRKFKIKEKISSEMQGGFSKFMIGSHSDYKKARTQRETMKNVNGVKSAFVVAYNEGKRITVQEGLMITNQKWFK